MTELPAANPEHGSAARAQRRFWLRCSKRPEVPLLLRELPLAGAQGLGPTGTAPWHGAAKTDGQWSRDGEIR